MLEMNYRIILIMLKLIIFLMLKLMKSQIKNKRDLFLLINHLKKFHKRLILKI